MADTIAPSPAAPASTPSPAPAPTAPSPAPAPAPSTPDSPFSKLDERAKTIKKPDEPVATPTPDKPVDQTPAPAPAAGDKKPVATETPKWYRQEMEKKGSELEKATRRTSELESKIADYERRGMDTSALNEQLKSKEAYAAKLEAEVAAIKYERSPEYKDKYQKPFDDAAEYAKQVVEQLKVEDGDEPRPAKWADFVKLYNMPVAQAEVEATRMFGGTSAIVMRHLDKLKELDTQRTQAVKIYEATAGEREKEARAKEVQQREQINTAWSMTNNDLIAANPDTFGEKADDDEGNALWKDSLELVDKAYTGRDKLTDKEKIVLDAHIRLRAAAYPRLQRELAMMKQERDDLLSRLGDKAASKPGKTQKPAAPAAAPDKDWRAEMKELGTTLIQP